MSGLFGMSNFEVSIQCRGFFGARIGVDSPFVLVSRTSGCFFLRRLYLKKSFEILRFRSSSTLLVCLLGACSF